MRHIKCKQLLDYLDEFEELGKIKDQADITGDYKSGNKAYKKMGKISEFAKKIDEKEEFYLAVLNTSTSANAIINCCADMLILDIYPKLARKKLKEIDRSKTYDPMLTFIAKMFLEEWDKGNIKI